MSEIAIAQETEEANAADKVNEKSERCACPDTYPDWDGQDLDLAGRCVHNMPIKTAFHMPLGYDTYVNKQYLNIHELALKEIWPMMVLTRTKLFGGEIIRFIEDAETASRMVQFLPPPFVVNVLLHHGGIGTIRKAMRQQQMSILDSGKIPKELYLAHLTCPVCEERKNGDKILLFRRWVASKRLSAALKAKEKRQVAKNSKKASASATKQT